MNDLILLITTSDRFYFEICKALLMKNEIEFRERNTVDSMYQNFGSYEIYIFPKDNESANQLIRSSDE